MKTVKSITTLRSFIKTAKEKGQRIGFIPTMGALHEGHLSLIRKCRKDNDIVVVSIFVNPTQFGPNEDLAAYPRPRKKDCLLAKKENVDILFYPSAKDIYPNAYSTYIQVEEITKVLCGKSRPTHFRGVATVVGKLLNIITPDTLYLGQKDAQQCVVIQRMVRDLNFPVQIKILPTIREKDGLAISSRNKYLSPQQRHEAPIIYKTLLAAKRKIREGQNSTARIKQFIRREICSRTSARIDYIECVDSKTLHPTKTFKERNLIAIAACLGTTRLIDNIVV